MRVFTQLLRSHVEVSLGKILKPTPLSDAVVRVWTVEATGWADACMGVKGWMWLLSGSALSGRDVNMSHSTGVCLVSTLATNPKQKTIPRWLSTFHFPPFPPSQWRQEARPIITAVPDGAAATSPTQGKHAAETMENGRFFSAPFICHQNRGRSAHCQLAAEWFSQSYSSRSLGWMNNQKRGAGWHIVITPVRTSLRAHTEKTAGARYYAPNSGDDKKKVELSHARQLFEFQIYLFITCHTSWSFETF